MTALSRKIGMTSYICLVAQMMPKRTVYLEHTPQDIHFLISSNRVLLGKLKSRNKMIKVRQTTDLMKTLPAAKEMEQVAVEQ